MTFSKVLEFTALDRRKDGGRIQISTGGVDRDKDRVFPQGAKTENYMRNPVVLWGHNYFSADSLIGRTKTLEITETGIVADFDLRPAANEADPQHVVLLLWEQEFVHASSIGFLPNWERMLPNDFGGWDFIDWELLEFSLVSVPANADALRLAAKSYPKAFEAFEKRGRVLSADNEAKIVDARDQLDDVLSSVAADDDGKAQLRAAITGLEAKIATLSGVLDQLLTRTAPPPPDEDDNARAVLARLDHIKAALTRRV